MTDAERIKVIVETFRFLGDGWLKDDEECKWAEEMAAAIEGFDFHGGRFCCPLCQEVRCDDNCPLLPIREAAREAAGDAE